MSDEDPRLVSEDTTDTSTTKSPHIIGLQYSSVNTVFGGSVAIFLIASSCYGMIILQLNLG